MTDPKDKVLPRLEPDEAGQLGDELAQLRDLVLRGDNIALAGGLTMAWWGLVLALVSFMFIGRYLDWLPPTLPVNPIGAVLGFGGSFVIRILVRRKSDFFRTWRSQALVTTWIFALIAYGMFVLGAGLTGAATARLCDAVLCLIYSLVFAVTATSSRRDWLFLASIGWLAAAAGIFAFDDVVARQSILGAGALLCMALPGLVLARAEWKALPA